MIKAKQVNSNDIGMITVSVCVLQRHSHCRNVKQFNVLVSTQLSGCISKFFCKTDQTQIQIKLGREFSYPVPIHTGLKTVNYIAVAVFIKVYKWFSIFKTMFLYRFFLLHLILLSFQEKKKKEKKKGNLHVLTAD